MQELVGLRLNHFRALTSCSEIAFTLFVLNSFSQVGKQMCVIDRDFRLCVDRARILRHNSMLLEPFYDFLVLRFAGLILDGWCARARVSVMILLCSIGSII